MIFSPVNTSLFACRDGIARVETAGCMVDCYIYIYIYIYVWREGERERERESARARERERVREREREREKETKRQERERKREIHSGRRIKFVLAAVSFGKDAPPGCRVWGVEYRV
jgi:hypothetical protein